MVRLGPLLYRQRTRKKLSLYDIEKALKIKSSFLLAIEKGEYNKLPSPAYAKGFVINYAAYLGIPKAEAVALFRREFDEKRAYKVLPDSLTREPNFSLRIKIKESFLLIGTLVILFLAYVFFQYRSALFPPALTVSAPQDGAV
ncbi:MAG TPA: helix-turn-helix domain-containing protein, partial [Patescibacteria group bacterium]